MNQPKDHKALAEAKAEGMDRFLRDYNAWWHRICKEAEAEQREFESGQYILNLETDDDA